MVEESSVKRWLAGVVGDTVGGWLVGSARWIALASMVVSIWYRCRTEERMLEGEFGEEWKAYKRRVRARFVPGVF